MGQPERAPRPVPDPRERLIEECAPLIRYLAERLAFRLPPSLDVSDLVHAGVIGLIDAIDKYDPKREAAFKTYAEYRIRGAMLDEIRSQDWVPRSVREKIALVQHAVERLEQRLTRAPSEEEIAAELGLEPERFSELLGQARAASLLSLDDLGVSEGPDRDVLDAIADPRAADPLGALVSKDVRTKLVAAIERLPQKERLVISLYYVDELTMKEIGRVLNVTESRVCQLHTQAVTRLRAALKRAETQGGP